VSGVLTIGESMALLVADRIGPAAAHSGYRLSIGGAEGNVAIGLARLGTPVTWTGGVANDPFGRVIVATLRGEGVDVRPVAQTGAASGLMVRTRPLPGRTAVHYYRRDSAGARLAPDMIDGSVIAAAEILHVTGITPALSETAAAAIAQAVRVAVAAGVPVSFDVNYRAALWSPEEAASVLAPLARQAAVLFAGPEEAELLTGAAGGDAQLAALGAWGVREIVIKDGARGARALIDGELFDAPAIVVDAIDTVGAGDAFVAGYLHARRRGDDPAARLDLAVRVAAYACTVEGDWEGLPREADLLQLTHDEPVLR